MPLILVIDDDQPLRDVTQRMLAAAGYETLTAESGAKGLGLWRERGADLVITDLRMSDMDGLTILAQLRTEAPGLPVIVMSGDASAGGMIAPDDRSPGATTLLPKPFLRVQLLDAVAAALRSAPGGESARHAAAGD
jgi:CheY-like chemotaxis protein